MDTKKTSERSESVVILDRHTHSHGIATLESVEGVYRITQHSDIEGANSIVSEHDDVYAVNWEWQKLLTILLYK